MHQTAVREFKVNINQSSAEFNGVGGVVVVASKSGTNRFSGEVFEFFRDKSLNAFDRLVPIRRLSAYGTPRLLYAVTLAQNFRDVLLGVAKRPRFVLPRTNPGEITSEIVGFWIRRWLAKRIENADVLQAVAQHTLTYPVEHGARVLLPEIVNDAPLFYSAR